MEQKEKEAPIPKFKAAIGKNIFIVQHKETKKTKGMVDFSIHLLLLCLGATVLPLMKCTSKSALEFFMHF